MNRGLPPTSQRSYLALDVLVNVVNGLVVSSNRLRDSICLVEKREEKRREDDEDI
jgi:hypothetical protein